MAEKKKLGRPPANWMFNLVELHFGKQWTSAYEVAEHLGLHVKTVKSFFSKLSIIPNHIVENGKARAQYKVRDLKEAVKLYIGPWL